MVKYFIVLDFEATCGLREDPQPQEIIEFPFVVIDAETMQVVDETQFYVRPVHNPTLTQFCTELTGITQEQVDAADPFVKVFRQYVKWIYENKYTDSLFVTCGDWDFKKMLPKQCETSKVKVPSRYQKWINIKKEFQKYYKVYGDLKIMLEHLSLNLEGRHHSGLDDCKNIARIWQRMFQDGYVLSEDSVRHSAEAVPAMC